MKKIFFLLAGIAMVVLISCDKNDLPVPLDYNTPVKLKINYSSAYAGNPPVQLKINDKRVSSSIIYSYPFPGGGLNTQGGSQPDYFSVPSGNVSVSLSVPKFGTNVDSIPLYSTSVNITEDGYYTLHFTDTLTNTQAVLFKENTANPDSGFSTYRFVNLIPNLPAVDLYFNNVLVAGNIAYKSASDYFNIAFPTASSWTVRPAGADPASTALATYANTSPNQRVLTVYARGFSGSTDANRRPNVSLFYVR